MGDGSKRKIVRLHIEIRDGHRCEVDEFGVVRRTSDPREADRDEQRSQGFQINLRRRMAVEKLIEHRNPETNAKWLKGYATVAASAMTMTRLLKGRSRSDKPALEWIARWCSDLPPADAQEAGATLAGMNGGSPRQNLIVFRPNFPISSLVASTAVSSGSTSGDPRRKPSWPGAALRRSW